MPKNKSCGYSVTHMTCGINKFVFEQRSWPPLLCPAEDDIFWHCLSCVAVNAM